MQDHLCSDVTQHILKILGVHGPAEDPVDVAILLEGKEILHGGGNPVKACILLQTL